MVSCTHTWVDLSGQIWGGHVPGDEFVGDADDVPEVRGEFETEDGELVSLQGVLERTARRVHAVVRGHQRVLDITIEVIKRQSFFIFSKSSNPVQLKLFFPCIKDRLLVQGHLD